MDFLAHHGLIGLVRTIPPKMLPGSDVGNLSAMGYDPSCHFSGRAPLEAANLGIEITSEEIVFRCNLVTVENQTMIDYSAGHISSERSAMLIDVLNQNIRIPNVKFYAGKSYRHLMVIKTTDLLGFEKTSCKPPHDILNQTIDPHLPKGPQEEFLQDLMCHSREILADHSVNKERIAQKQNPANMIWLWGQGKKPNLPLFKEKFGLSGSVISAVDLVNGIGRLAGLTPIKVPGATGYYDTDYYGKARYALDSLKEKDFVFIHIESPDEASHNGDLSMKIKCIEAIDQKIVGTILDHLKSQINYRILILPDHYTPVKRRTHTSEPVCFVMSGQGIQKSGSATFSEKQAEASRVLFESGEVLMEYFIKK